ncbi:hypothetical protein [Curtobacterium sp. RRHDQ10]|uniref:hypothetical protein n=1 Tax=Curtobacterium phyllosphaerae TaxID=3413379 RepID=UPI003BF26EE8
MRDEELAAASARHAERVRAAGGVPRDSVVPEQPLDERVARARSADSARTRRAADQILAGRGVRAARNLADVDDQARIAWGQVGPDEADFDARVTLAAAIHAARAATVARQRNDETTDGAARAARGRLASRIGRRERGDDPGRLGDVLDGR